MRSWITGVLALMLTMCPPARSSTPDDDVVVAISLNSIISFDPAESFETVSTSCLAFLYQTLVKSDREDATQLRPDLALSWREGKAGRSLIFQLDPGATFASGAPVLADDVIFSLSRAVKLNRTPVFILNELGWEPGNIDRQFRKIDDHQLEIRWSNEISSELALRLLSSSVASVVDSKRVLAFSESGDFGNRWLKTRSAGSGGYQIRHYIPQQSLLLETNPYAQRMPRLRRVILKDVVDPSVRRLLLLQGDVDAAYSLSADQFSALMGQPGIRVEMIPGNKVYYLGFNTAASDAEFLGNPAFWQAARWLVDYEGLASGLLKNQFTVHQNFLPQGIDGAVTEAPFRLDVEKAKAILAQAGIPAGSRFSLMVINQPPYTDIAQALQASFALADIRIDVQPLLESELWSRMRARRFQAVFVYWGPDYADPNSNAGAFAFNMPGRPQTLASRLSWRIPALSQLTHLAAAERDPRQRREDYRVLQQAVRENSPFVVMMQGKLLVAVRDNLLNVRMGMSNSVLYFDEIDKMAAAAPSAR
ncbi:ABC transporter substrate-binding protein [Musicola paradisiaca]|nr:ABC transporter substrate-binding protein [Musicola paradisiaca]